MRSKVFLVLLAGAIPYMAGAQQSSSNSTATGVRAQGGASAQGSASVQNSSGTAVQSQSSAAGGASGSVSKGDKGLNADTGATTNAVLSGSLDAKRAKPGDPVTAKTSEPSSTPDHTNLPKGTRLVGHVTEVKAAGGAEGQSVLAFKFDRAVLKDGREIPIQYTVRALAAAESGTEASTGDAMDGGVSGATMAAGGAGMGHNAMGAAGRIGTTAGGALGNGIGSVGRVSGGVAGSAGSTLGASSRALKGGAGAVGGIDARGLLTADSHGVFGMKDLSLSQSAAGESSAMLTSAERNVHVDSGTRMLLSAQEYAGPASARPTSPNPTSPSHPAPGHEPSAKQ
jgi:hypothetical protein